MGKHFTSIEINGKLYDARTGKLLSGSQPNHPTPVPSTSQRMSDIAPRPVGAKTPHRKLERSKTLMRHAVKRPARSATPMKAAHAVSTAAPAVATFVDFKRPTTLSHNSDSDREIRAAKVKRSTLVKKFSDMSMPGGKVHNAHPVQPMAVKPVPVHIDQPQHKHPKTQSVLEKGLRNAQSHNQEFKSPSKKHLSKGGRRARLASIGAGSLAALLLVGFFGYQNIPNLSMRYATARAGINASLPGYKPSGFALNSHIQYNSGQITVQFKSNTDDRAFTITQRESSWNSDTLRQNYVATAGEQVHTYEDKGRTIYLYGGSNATWVNGGVWYDIQSSAQLNSDQLIRIATSM